MVLETFKKKAVSVMHAPAKKSIHLAVALDAEFLKTACATHVRSIAFVPFLVVHPDSGEAVVEDCLSLAKELPVLQPRILSLPASYVLQISDQIPAGHIIHDQTYLQRYANFSLLDRIDPYLVPNPMRHGALVDCCLHALPMTDDSPSAKAATTATEKQQQNHHSSCLLTSKRKEYSSWDPVLPFPSRGSGSLKGVEKLFVNEAISILEESTKEQSINLPGTMGYSMFGRGAKKGRVTFAKFLRLYGLDAYSLNQTSSNPSNSKKEEPTLQDAVIGGDGVVAGTGTIDRDTVRSFLKDCFHDSSEHLHAVDRRLPIDSHYMPRVVIDRPGDPQVTSSTLTPAVDFLQDFPSFSQSMHEQIAEYQEFTAANDMSLGIYGYGNADNLVIQNSLEYPHDKRSEGGVAFRRTSTSDDSGGGGSVVHDWTSNRAFLDFCKFDLKVEQTPGLVKSINGAAVLGEPCSSFIDPGKRVGDTSTTAPSLASSPVENGPTTTTTAGDSEEDSVTSSVGVQVKGEGNQKQPGHDNHNPMWDAAALAMLIAQFGC